MMYHSFTVQCYHKSNNPSNWFLLFLYDDVSRINYVVFVVFFFAFVNLLGFIIINLRVLCSHTYVYECVFIYKFCTFVFYCFYYNIYICI